MAIYNKIQSSSHLIDFERFSNFHFAITRDNCDHIFRYVEALEFQNTAGAKRAYLSVCQLRSLQCFSQKILFEGQSGP